MEGKTLWTPQQIAKWLSVSVRHVQNLAKAGQIPGIRVGNTWRFDRDEVEAKLRGKS